MHRVALLWYVMMQIGCGGEVLFLLIGVIAVDRMCLEPEHK